MNKKFAPYYFVTLSAFIGFACGTSYFLTPFVRFGFLAVAIILIAYGYAILERFNFYDDISGEKDFQQIEEEETDDNVDENETPVTESSDETDSTDSNNNVD